MMFERQPLLFVAPLLAASLAVLAVAARRARMRAAFAWSRALGERARALGKQSPAWIAVASLAAALGLAGPRWGAVASTAESRALNIALVVDMSRSMLAEDVAPSRLGRAVSLGRRLIQDLDGDRFALVAFSGHPYLLSPLTLDESAIALQLDALDPDIASVGGSGLSGALDLARSVLVKSTQGGDRVIVLLTDGETFDPAGALAAAGRALRRANITLVAIPVGDTRGARIPENGDWHRDQSGNVVITRRRDDLLMQATDAAGGVFIPASAPDPAGDARRALAHLNRARTADRTAADLVPRAWILALIAGLLLLAQTITRRSASLIVLALMFGGGRLAAQRPSAGTRLLSLGDTAQARRAFLAEAKTRQSDTVWFNAGTSALQSGDLATAAELLTRATLSLDPALRQRAMYNLGTAYLLQARRDSVRRDTLLSLASSRLREALLMSPGDRNAKFNYELARHLKPPPKQQSGPAGRGRGGQPPPPPPSAGRSGMTPSEADQVLNAMERAERETRQRQRARRGEPPSGPDW